MKVRTFVLVAVVGAMILPALASAQGYGEGFGVGGVLLPSGQTTIIAKTRLGPSLGVEAALGLAHTSDDNVSSTGFSIGGGLLMHGNADRQFQPYFGGRVSIDHQSSDWGGQDQSSTSFGIAGVLGGEFFVAKNLSFDTEISLRLGFGSLSISTQSALAFLIYL